MVLQDKSMTWKKALYTHCYSHSLNLAASDTLQNCKVMKTALETTHEITKLIKYSPRRQNLFDSIKEELAPIRVLFPQGGPYGLIL